MLANENVMFYLFFYVVDSEVKGILQYFLLEFCFTYYTVIYVCIIYFFCVSISCIFVILYSNLLDFTEIH